MKWMCSDAHFKNGFSHAMIYSCDTVLHLILETNHNVQKMTNIIFYIQLNFIILDTLLEKTMQVL